ncbi:MAG: Fe-S protein, partial [Burkholderiales bacterium]
MARLFSNRERPFDLGALPTELLARDPGAAIAEARMPGDAAAAAPESILDAIPEYRELCVKFFDGEVAPKRAPVPGDPLTRARNLKASAYFLDATLAGVCKIESSDWTAAEHAKHTHAFVFLVEFGREPKAGEPGDAWIRGTNAARTDVRCAEVAVVLAGYLRTLGWSARGH